ncbi:hypothetical protein PVAND_005137 [Polypedilum vanderplanki]|uniref:Uncharacterized protein n=1 Tax=Polypedilum vanderplanki TaxID=319348 RepID=A0A9J6C051_POLVA|nr:hypothetical protein PVAND_005137 [Polypedilum vanderplanki]
MKNIIKFNKIKTYLSELVNNQSHNTSIECLVFIESWISYNELFKVHAFKNYNSIVKGRGTNVSGGGIAIFIKKEYSYREILCEFNADYESVLLEILKNGKSIHLLAIYRIPNGNMDNFLIMAGDYIHKLIVI